MRMNNAPKQRKRTSNTRPAVGSHRKKILSTLQQKIDFRDAEPVSMPVPTIFSRLAPLKETAVFDTYWRFAAERQSVFMKRAQGMPGPWTSDPVLNEHKFTNPYRATDRVSQYLIRSVLYSKKWSNEDLFFRTILFKFFNRISTWKLLEDYFGDISYRNFDFNQCDEVLTAAMKRSECIYSAAYIMPSGNGMFGKIKKHRMHLMLLKRMMMDGLPDRIANSRTMQDAFDLLKGYPTIGDFLAYQYATDLNYSTLTNFTEMEFVIPGPGAKDGIRKCFSDLGGLSESEVIRIMADRQDAEFSRLGLKFLPLGNRRLQLIDCQNLFCETDKYARVVHPDVQVGAKRVRIKQKFKENPTRIDFAFPPKWKVTLLVNMSGSAHGNI